jgi:hypothetical protein
MSTGMAWPCHRRSTWRSGGRHNNTSGDPIETWL